MNYDSLKALAAQIFYLRNATEETTDYRGFKVAWPEEPEGLRLLGAGCFGAAYELPDGRVLKLGKIIDGTSLWISEAAKHFAVNGKPMRDAPKVWAFDTIEYTEKTTKQVFITAEPSLAAKVCVYSLDVGYQELPSKWVRGEDRTKVGWWAVMEKVKSEAALAEEMDRRWQDLPDTVRSRVLRWADTRELGHGEALNDDMHFGNWGRAVDGGRIVVFDPFSGSCTTTLTTTYTDGSVRAKVKRMAPHRMIQHAGPTKGRWARG